MFLDENADGFYQSGEQLLAGWVVEIISGGSVVATATTNAAGFYQVDNLPAGGGYDIVFRHPDTNVVWGIIANVTIPNGAVTADQNLPIDPTGVFYDSVARVPIANVQVTITDASGSALPDQCLLDPSQQNQVTASDGRYRFDLVPGADPACPVTETECRISFTAPSGFLSAPSTLSVFVQKHDAADRPERR